MLNCVEAVCIYFSPLFILVSTSLLLSPFSFIKSLEWPSEALCPAWYVRNSAEQPWRGRRGRRVKEEDEGRVLYKSPPKALENPEWAKRKCSWERTVWETLKRQGNNCLLGKKIIFFLLCEINRLRTWSVESLKRSLKRVMPLKWPIIRPKKDYTVRMYTCFTCPSLDFVLTKWALSQILSQVIITSWQE